MYNQGISRTGDVLDLGVEEGIITKRGAFYSYGDIRLAQGRENAKGFLSGNRSILFEIENKIRALKGLPPVAFVEPEPATKPTISKKQAKRSPQTNPRKAKETVAAKGQPASTPMF